MLLLDGILSWSVDFLELTAAAVTNTSNIFFDDDLGGLPSYTGFEYMAQTVARAFRTGEASGRRFPAENRISHGGSQLYDTGLCISAGREV